jgi:hypothetical protein
MSDNQGLGTIEELSEALARLARVVEALQAERDEDRALIDKLMDELADQGPRKPQKPPVYDTWVDWVDGWLAARVSRHPHRYRWCRQYGNHPEVADRLEALWLAWERQWPDPLQRLAWYRDGLDQQLVVITADDGPLRACSAAEDEHVACESFAKQWSSH